MMKKLNRKGFTLIELLAVIIILAILMTLAITAMSGYITNAKKDTFVTTAQSYASAARLNFVNGDYDQIARGNCIVIKTSEIPLESGSKDSPFGHPYVAAGDAGDENITSYVVIRNVASATDESDRYEYYVQMVDRKGNGFGLMKESDLERENVIQETAMSASKPSGSYQDLPTKGALLKLYEGGVNGKEAGTCTVSEVY